MASKSNQQFGRWPGEQERQPITDAINELASIANQDCWDAPNYKEDCTCDRCVCVRAVEAMRSVLYPVVRSLSPERIESGFPERLFFEAWKETNVRRRGFNGGRGTLEILCKDLGPVTQRDMDVATAVMQWLGTSCGTGFLHEVQRQIERVREEGRKHCRDAMKRVRGESDAIGITRPVVVD
jgi:hypothetical protein